MGNCSTMTRSVSRIFDVGQGIAYFRPCKATNGTKEEQDIEIIWNRLYYLKPKACVVPVQLRAFGETSPLPLAVVPESI